MLYTYLKVNPNDNDSIVYVRTTGMLVFPQMIHV
jgi:hypothetical protein